MNIIPNNKITLDDQLVLCISRQHIVAVARESIPEDEYLHKGENLIPLKLDDLDGRYCDFLPRKIVDTKVNTFVPGLVAMSDAIAHIAPQLLAYVVVVNDETNKILSYARKVSGEVKLLNSRSIGFGGHTEVSDADIITVKRQNYSSESGRTLDDYQETFVQIQPTLLNTIKRELTEELGITLPEYWQDNINFSEYVIIDNTPDPSGALAVGQAHIGLAYVYRVSDNIAQTINETSEAQELKWVDLTDLQEDFDMYESWSRILIKGMIRGEDLTIL